jgi:hypothetical protein
MCWCKSMCRRYCRGMADSTVADGPTLLVLVGPPAVGKMTVGRQIAARTHLHLFHNHVAIDFAAEVGEIGSGPFRRVVRDVRQRVMEEAAENLPGLIFTYVWDYSDPADREPLDRYGRLFTRRGGRVLFVELQADQAVRLGRNTGSDRLAAKPTKRDLPASRRNLLTMDERYQLASDGRLDGPDYLRIDNTHLAPDVVAQQVIDYFNVH